MKLLTPLYRRTVGFDTLFDLLDESMKHSAEGCQANSMTHFPHYNIEKHADENADRYKIVMALAGFNKENIDITFQGNRLTVAGNAQEETEAGNVVMLHKGIATRAFKREFNLADHVKVVDATFKDGLLTIELVREMPEEEKPNRIPVKDAA